MKMTITAAAALIGAAVAFGPVGTAPAASLPNGTQVIEVGGGHDFGGHRWGRRDFRRHGGGRDFRHRGGGRDFGRHRGGRDFGRRGDRRFGRRGDGRRFGHGHGHGHGHHHGHGHGYYDPYFYGGLAFGTYLFLNAIDDY